NEQSPIADIDLIFGNHLLTDNSIYGATFSLRSTKGGYPMLKKLTCNVVHKLALKHGYKAKLIFELNYGKNKNMGCFFWSINWNDTGNLLSTCFDNLILNESEKEEEEIDELLNTTLI